MLGLVGVEGLGLKGSLRPLALVPSGLVYLGDRRQLQFDGGEGSLEARAVVERRWKDGNAVFERTARSSRVGGDVGRRRCGSVGSSRVQSRS